MDLSHPLRSLAPSLDSDVLEVLARTDSALALAAIVRLADRGSRMGLHDAVRRLVAQGIVQEVPAGRAPLYRLSRDHVLADVVLAAARAGREVRERLTDLIASWGPEVVNASLFGSFARQEAGPLSDIDVLLVLRNDANPDGAAWLERVEAASTDVERWTGNRLQCVAVTVAQLHSMAAAGEPIVESWRRDGELLVGEHLIEILQVSV